MYIKQHLNVFTYEKNLEIYNSILQKQFTYGEQDRIDTSPIGMVSNLSNDDPLIFLLNTKVQKLEPNKKRLQRAYINFFAPNERPFFHFDGDVFTCLFYFLPLLDKDEGGETQFYIDDCIKGILPIPGSMVCFDGNIEHRATSFRTKPRITVALKYKM